MSHVLYRFVLYMLKRARIFHDMMDASYFAQPNPAFDYDLVCRLLQRDSLNI
jgi:hypothetical protein